MSSYRSRLPRALIAALALMVVMLASSLVAQANVSPSAQPAAPIVPTNTPTDTPTNTPTSTPTNTPVTVTSQIAPTSSTCQQFIAGTAPTLSAVHYSVSRGKIARNMNPGEFIYYDRLTAPTDGTQTVTIA